MAVMGQVRGGNGGSTFNPTEKRKASANTNENGSAFSVLTVGKWYAITYQDDSSTSTDTIVGLDPNTISEFFSNAVNWGTKNCYTRTIIGKANGTSLTISNNVSRVWGMVVIQLD